MVLKYHILEIAYYVDGTAIFGGFVVFAVRKRLREGLLTTCDAFFSHDREAIAVFT